MSTPVLCIDLQIEQDIVLARQRARTIAGLVGFGTQDQTRIATAVSEIARSAFTRAGSGKIEFSLADDPPALRVRVKDRGSGRPDLTAVGRMMDILAVESKPEGTNVVVGRRLPRAAQSGPALGAFITTELTKLRTASPLEELQTQNQELLGTLDELRQQKERLVDVNRELEDTNRGVVALLAELDVRADYLKRVNDLKTSFLSNMTHEFRTPLNSIISLTGILRDRLDGPLNEEQEKQVAFIRKAAEGLTELVNDLLDLAKVEAGRIIVRPGELKVSELFSALRGMLRPLVANNSTVNLLIEDPAEDIVLNSDEPKISQILRNLISNALKFTERGEVRVSARRGEGDFIVFSVADTGIGIAPGDLERIFEEFSQIETPIHRRVHSTGLGLPLSRRLAGLLGGSIRVNSQLGKGSTFVALIPAEFVETKECSAIPDLLRTVDATQSPVLVVEDNREALFVYEKHLRGSGYQVLPARTLRDARDWLKAVRPVAIILDVLLETETTWQFISELKHAETTKDIPIIVVTMVENEKRSRRL